MTGLRVAMLAHSTNPRGGVVHALALSEALTALGAETVLHAPDAGPGFFRAAACETRPFPVGPAPRDLTEMVERRIADYVDWFGCEDHRGFDVYHAHDGISGNALATLKAADLIPGFVRTVHHTDAFPSARLEALQARSIHEADALLVVSEFWKRKVKEEFDRDAEVSGNGVDLATFTAQRDGADARLRARLRLGEGPVFVSVGGIEARKNTLRMLSAFDLLARETPSARYVIAGGASLLDHSAYQVEFRSTLAAMGSRADEVVLAGPLADSDMPALYRLASAFVFASVKEGFGICVLEAMACGTPVVVSRLEPFTSYLDPDDVLFCDPYNPASIAEAMREALNEAVAARLRISGFAVAARHDWRSVAERSLSVYRRLKGAVHA